MRTYGEMMTAMEACATKEQAEELVHELVVEAISERPLLLKEEARTLVLHNLGYLTGYLGRKEAGRLLELFGTRHPYLGAIEDWPKTPEEIIDMGKTVTAEDLARAMYRGVSTELLRKMAEDAVEYAARVRREIARREREPEQ